MPKQGSPQGVEYPDPQLYLNLNLAWFRTPGQYIKIWTAGRKR